MANVGVSAIKLIDSDGDVVGVTGNALDVHIKTGTSTIDIGDVSLLLGGTAASTNAGTMDAQTLRVTLATDDTHFGEVGATASSTGGVHAQLRTIVNSLSSQTGMATNLGNISTYTLATYNAVAIMDDWDATHDDPVVADGLTVMAEAKSIDGSALPNTTAEGDAIRIAATRGGVLYSTLSSLDGQKSPVIDDDDGQVATPSMINVGGEYRSGDTTYGDGDATILQTNVNGALKVVGTVDLGSTDNGVLDAIAASLEILDDWDDSNYANVNINLAGTDVSADEGDADSGTLRVTIADDDNHFGAVGGGADVDGTIHGQLRYIGTAVNNIEGDTGGIAGCVGTDGSTGPAKVMSIGGTVGIGGNIQEISVDASGTLNVNVLTIQASTNTIEIVGDAAENANAAGNPVLIGGRYDSSARTLGNTDVGALALNASGHVLIDVVDGGVLESTLDGVETVIGVLTNAIGGNEMQVDVVAALPAGTNAIGKLAANSGVDIGDVDITSIAAGDNNIGNVDIASALPAGSNTIGVVDLGATDNAVLDAMVVDLAAIEALLITIDSDTNSTQGYLSNLSGTQYADDANWTDGSSKHLLVGGLYQSSMQSVTDGDVAPFQVDANGVMRTSHSITGGGDGKTVVTTAGTDVALGISTVCKKVDIQAQTDNTGLIAVGFTGVDATVATGTGVILNPGDVYSLEIDNLVDIYIDATVDGEGVRYTYFT